MLEVRPQACPAPERYCCESATGGQGIDSLSWNLQLHETISTREQGVHQLLRLAHRTEAKVAAALAAAGLVLSPAFAATQGKKRPPAVALSFDPISSRSEERRVGKE